MSDPDDSSAVSAPTQALVHAPTAAPTFAPSYFYHFATHHGHRAEEPGAREA